MVSRIMPSRILIFILYLAVARGSTVRERSTTEQPPCFVNDVEGPTIVYTLDYYLQTIKTSIRVLKLNLENILQQMNIEYCISLSNAGRMTATFIDLSAFDPGTDGRHLMRNFFSNTKSFLMAMRSHFDKLNELAYYLEQLHLTPFDNTSGQWLTLILHNMYDCMCNVKTALRSRNQDPVVTVPYGELSELFTTYRGGSVTRCIQHTSEYITVLDIKRFIDYLETVYNPLNI